MNIRNVHNSIPLHLALAKGAKSCVGLLLSAGADYNLQVFYSSHRFCHIMHNITYKDIKLASFVVSFDQ